MIEPGAKAFLALPGSPPVEVMITGVTIRPGGRLVYEATWFADSGRTCQLVEACEVTADAPDVAAVSLFHPNPAACGCCKTPQPAHGRERPTGGFRS